MKRTWSQREEYGQLGIIESVNLRNFMCHDNLNFDFYPHMNFIVGRNGSGKSAVLTAIILALGGKSGATGRFNNIKGFIKTGKSSATVSVTLKNCGDNAYKQDEFGEKITVERHFTSEGVSSYKLKSQSGRIISTSKEELLSILSVMDIQIENPITVLTQEISRNFLVSKNSKADKLFQLFFKGTGLAKVQQDYTRGRQQEEEMKEELKYKKSILPEMEKEVQKQKALFDKSKKIPELRKELLWAMVTELEKRRDEKKEALENVEKDYSNLKKKLSVQETELANIQQNMSTSKADKKDLSEKISSIRKDLQELSQKRISLTSEIRQIQGTFSSLQRQLKTLTDNIINIENIISDIKMKNENELNEDKLRHEMIVNQLKKDIMYLEAQINKLDLKKNSLREAEADLQKKMDACHAEIQEMTYLKYNLTREKEQLERGKVDRINVYGQEMVDTLKYIQRAVEQGYFNVPPKGPIGLYINVKRPEWNFAVQECLKVPFLRIFLCDNHADAECLIKILNRNFTRNRPSVLTTKFVTKVYDVTSHKTVCDHPTLLDMLDIPDPVVANCIIDQRQIENILLIDDEMEARNLMLYNPPRNCSFAYTPNGDQYCHSPYRNYSCRNRNQISMLKSVNEEDIRKKEEELLNIASAKSQKFAEKENLNELLKQKEQEISEIANNVTDLKIKLNSVKVKLHNEENSYEEPKDVNCLQSDLEQLQKEKDNCDQQYIDCKSILNEKTEELSSLDKSASELKRILQIESRNFHALSEKIDEYENKKEKIENTVQKIKDQLRQLEPVLEDHKKELANAEAIVKLSTKNAEDACSTRIETRRSPDTIRQILEETEKVIQQQRNYDQQAIFQEYAEKKQIFLKKKSELERLERINARITLMLEKRFEIFKHICKNTAVNLSCKFTMFLKDNNFSGYSIADFESQTLEILVKPKKAVSKDVEFSSLSQLSGGERSYVTIAFLLSLWDRVNMPFRILDEYDVFMDSNNRHLSINLLINTAKANKKIQYIFLSPLELPDIDDSDHVKVHKMPDPRK